MKRDKSQIKHKYRQKPTTKQLMALQLINQGATARQAMLKAGYSKRVASHPKDKLFNSQAVLSVIDSMRMKLGHQGITLAYLSGKFKQWLEAQDKDGNPDNRMQLEAYKELKDIYGLKPDIRDSSLARRVTLEEFVYSEKEDSSALSGTQE